MSWVRRRLEEVTGGGPVYPLLILFGLNAVDELDRTAFGILLPEIRDALRPRQPGDPLDRRSDRSRVARPHDPDRPLRRPGAPGEAGAGRRGRRGRSSRSPPGSPGPLWVLVVARSGSSIGKAVVDPTHNSLIADYYAPEHRPKAYSFHRAANAVGAFIGPLLAGVIAFNTSWRVPFFVFAIPTHHHRAAGPAHEGAGARRARAPRHGRQRRGGR